MSPTATEQYIGVLAGLESGNLGLLRTHAGQGLDASVDAFDLFAGLWWPLQNRNTRVPRREVAWLIAKLYAFRPIAHTPGRTLVTQLRRCEPISELARQRFRQRFDRLLMLPLGSIEPALQWALAAIATDSGRIDWVRMTDDLSAWERESTRLTWAEEFLGESERS